MEGMAQFFSGGGDLAPVSPEEIQLVSLVGFMLVALIHSCGSLRQNPERILSRMVEHGRENPALSKAVGFVVDALKKHPVDTYGKWFVDRAQFPELARYLKAGGSA